MSDKNSYEWGANYDADVQRILNAGMPDEFWQDIAAVYADVMPRPGGIKRHDLLGDTLEVYPSYAVLLRDGRRVRSFSHKQVIGVAYKKHKAARSQEIALAMKTRDDAKTTWNSV